MSAPFLSEEEVAAPEEQRNYTGWICFFSLILMLMLLTWKTSAMQNPDRLEGFEEEQSTLRKVMSAESLEKSLGTPLGEGSKSTRDTLGESLSESVSGLALTSGKSPMAAMLYAEMRTYQKEPVPREHLAILEKSRVPADRAFYEIYTSAALTRDQANKLIAKLPDKPFVYVAAKAQALQKAGDKDAVRRLVPATSILGFAILMAASWPFLGISFAIWLIFMRQQREGKLDPKGIPMDSLSMADADRLAMRATQIFVTFILVQFLVAGVIYATHLPINEEESGAIAGLLTIVSVFLLQRLPMGGKLIRLDTLGVSAANLKRDVILGVLGFVAEFPVAMMLAELSGVVMRWLPRASHPATDALEKSHDLRTLIPVLIAGSIVAPFWEEIVFRGLLFPGLKRLLGGMTPAIVLSSLLFACVHSQGITLWLPLGFVGATSCYLSYQSRSLVPGMVMHCLHNTAIFVMILLM